jgi:hypothetical protein
LGSARTLKVSSIAEVNILSYVYTSKGIYASEDTLRQGLRSLLYS